MAGQDGGSFSPRLPTGPGVPLGLVALAALIYSLSGGTAVQQVTATGEAKKSTSVTVALSDDALKPLYEFLDVQKGRGAASSPCGESAPYDVEFVIATVPDPIDSHLAPSFDRAVDAIQRGLQSTSFTLDRSYIPWKRDSASTWELSLAKSPLAVTTKPGSSDVHRKTPGTLLFRDSQDPYRLFVVFLVGEVPTWGIQREAMTAALNAIEEAEKGRHCLVPSHRTIRILGPYFSGSTASLRDALAAWNLKKRRRVSLISGSATVDSNQEKLNRPNISFSATVIPDRSLTLQFNRFLRERLRADSTDTALFVEGGTSYGSANSRFAVRAQGTGSTSEEDLAPLPRPKFTVDFPLHVAQLRAAYEKDAALRNPSGQSRSPRHSLELALETNDQPSRDVIPPQDAVATASTADLTLGDSIEAIRREQVRFVGIIASDPRDVLFLARRIREAGSDATLFTYGADVLFTHADYFRFLRGMLIVTPYPIIPGNQSITRTGWHRVSFAGFSEEGIYNGMRYFGGETARLLDYRLPSPIFDNAGPNRPPIWITVVGRESFWPVDVSSDYCWFDTPESRLANAYVLRSNPVRRQHSKSASDSSIPDAPEIPRPPGGVLSLVLTEVTLAVLALAYWAARRNEAALVTPCPVHGTPIPVEGDGIRSYVPESVRQRLTVWTSHPERRINRMNVCLLALGGASIQAALLITLLATGSLFRPSRFVVNLLFALGLLNLAALAGAVGREALALSRETSSATQASLGDRVRERFEVLPIPLLTFGIAIGLLSYGATLTATTTSQLLSFYSRVFDLTSAVSPLVPFALTAVVLMSWPFCNLDRAYLMRLRGSSFEEFDGISGLREAERGVRRLIEQPPLTRAVLLLLPIAAFVPFYRILDTPLDTIDGSGWGSALKILLIASYLAISYAVVTFLALWLRLRSVLRRLASHPLFPAFQRLPDSMASTPWRMWRADPSLTSGQASVSHLRLLANLKPRSEWSQFWSQLAKDADDADLYLDNAFRVGHRGFIATLECQQHLKEVLRRATSSILAELRKYWKTWPGPPDPGKKMRQLAAKEPYMDAATWLGRETPTENELWVNAAEEYLAIRITSFIRYVFLQLRNLLSFSLIGFVLSLVAVASYPFHPRRPFMALAWIIGILSIAAIGTVLVSIERDHLLSYIGKTKPGEITINREFVTTMMLYVAVPLLTLLATQFPGLGDVIYSIFTPALKAVH